MWEEKLNGENPCNQVGTGNPNPHARLWSEVGFELGSTDWVKGWDRNH